MSIDAIHITKKTIQPAKNNSHQRPASRQHLHYWLFTSLAMAVVLLLWFFSLKTNWQRFSQPNPDNESGQKANQNLSSLKSKFDQVLNQAGLLLTSFNDPAPGSAAASASDPSVPAANSGLTKKQIELISDELDRLP